jgi:hypothetical protein
MANEQSRITSLKLEWDGAGNAFSTAGMTSSDTPNAPDDLGLTYPNHVQFYKYCPGWDGEIEFDTCQGNSGFDSYLYLLRKDATMTDTVYTEREGYGQAGCGSRINAPVKAGEHYYIGVGGFADSTGSYTLTVAGPASSCGGASSQTGNWNLLVRKFNAYELFVLCILPIQRYNKH